MARAESPRTPVTPSWSVGAEWRHTVGAVAFGPRLYGRAETGRGFSLEAGLWGRIPVSPVSDLDEALVAIAYQSSGLTTFQSPIEVDQLAVSALAEWGLRPASPPRGLWATPVLTAGLEARLTAEYAATVDPDWLAGVDGAEPVVVSDPATDLRVGPALGAGAEVGIGPRFVIDLGMLARFAPDKEPDYGNIDAAGNALPLDTILTTSVVWSLGARWAFGGAR